MSVDHQPFRPVVANKPDPRGVRLGEGGGGRRRGGDIVLEQTQRAAERGLIAVR